MSELPPIRRYYDAFLRSQQVLDELKISSYPLDVFDFLDRAINGYSLSCHYAPLEKSVFPSVQDGCCYYHQQQDTYFIFYNDQTNAQRMKFTILHELAHILLGHVSPSRPLIQRQNLPSAQYMRFEGEANAFASNVLAPPILIHEKLNSCQSISKPLIRSFFNISASAADFREEDYTAWKNQLPTKAEMQILERCRDSIHTHFCSVCRHYFTGKDAKYCPICRNSSLSPTAANNIMLYYEAFGLSSYENNSCPNCNTSAENQDRYCRYCSSETMGLISCALPDWRSVAMFVESKQIG